MNALQCQLNEDDFDIQNYLDEGRPRSVDNTVQDLPALYHTIAEFRIWLIIHSIYFQDYNSLTFI